MKRSEKLCLLIVALLLASLSLAQQPNAPTRPKAFETAPDISYDSVPNFLKMPPNTYMGEGIGVARNSKGHVFVYTRSGETRPAQATRTFARNSAASPDFQPRAE